MSPVVATPAEDLSGRRRDALGLVHIMVRHGHGFSEYEALWCSGEPAHALEYEDEDEMLTCLACLSQRRFDL